MSHTSSNIVGPISGFVGYWLGKTWLSLKVVFSFFMLDVPVAETNNSDLHAAIFGIIMAILGWLTVRLLDYFFPKFLKRKKDEGNQAPPHTTFQSRSDGK